MGGVAGVKSKQYKGGEGLKHLLDKHGEADARRLPKALLDGQMSISKKNPDERDIDGKSYRAVLVKNHKRRNAWVLTGYTNKHRTHL